MRIKYLILLAATMLMSGQLLAQELPSAGTPTTVTPTLGSTIAPADAPLSQSDVIAGLKKKGQTEQLKEDIKKRGVDFEVNDEVEKQLHKAKATADVIDVIKQNGPKARAAATKAAAIASGMSVVPEEESADWKALKTELDPDRVISMAEAYGQKYPKSDVLSYVYAFEASAYETKGDAAKTVEIAEKSLSIKNDNLMALLMVAYAIPQPQFIKLHSNDEEKQLARAEAYCNDAQKAIDALKKSDAESEADFADRKAGYISNLHADRGMIHLDRAQQGLMSLDTDELAKSVKEYNEAVSYSRAEATDYFRLGEANELLGKNDDAITAYSKAAELGKGVLKQYSEAKVAKLKAAKSAGK